MRVRLAVLVVTTAGLITACGSAEPIAGGDPSGTMSSSTTTSPRSVGPTSSRPTTTGGPTTTDGSTTPPSTSPPASTIGPGSTPGSSTTTTRPEWPAPNTTQTPNTNTNTTQTPNTNTNTTQPPDTTPVPPITQAPATTQAPSTTQAPAEWRLVWSDEFDGTAIDRRNWTYDIGGWGWGNGEAQYYTDRPENARVENGALVIELRQESYEGSSYTSARLKSQGLREFQYGRMEARVKVPRGTGTWPAFWMLGHDFNRFSGIQDNLWPNVGEIDVMEFVGREPRQVIGAMHGPGYSGAGGIAHRHDTGIDLAADFHVYAVDWDETGITWSFDGSPFARVPREQVSPNEWVFDQPFFFLLNLALGGTLGGVIGPDLEFPVRMYVDHVRVYQRTG